MAGGDEQIVHVMIEEKFFPLPLGARAALARHVRHLMRHFGVVIEFDFSIKRPKRNIDRPQFFSPPKLVKIIGDEEMLAEPRFDSSARFAQIKGEGGDGVGRCEIGCGRLGDDLGRDRRRGSSPFVDSVARS